jgi:hypothetical protein
MKHATLCSLLLAFALVALALEFVLSCLGPWVETPGDWKVQRETMRQISRESAERLAKRYGNRPVGEWDERHEQIYHNAKRILRELCGRP